MAQTLYRFFDSNHNLLYVGISVNWQQRLKQHYKDSPFHDESAYITLTHYQTREEVEDAEKRAIMTEGAKYNKAFNPNYETVLDHFQKLKAWIYMGLEPDQIHAEMVARLKEIRLEDKDWTRKTTGFIAYHFLENYPHWDYHGVIKCEFCDKAFMSEALLSWTQFIEEKKNAAN